MVLTIKNIPKKIKKIKVSFNNKRTWASYVVRKSAIDIPIPRYGCENLDEIYYMIGDKIFKPIIEDDSCQFYFSIESTKTKYVNFLNLDNYLSNLEQNTETTPVELHVITKSITTLKRLNDVILKHKKYVNISFTNLRHEEYNTSFLDSWDDPSIAGDVDSLKPFPSVFKDNPYIIGITIPKNDNYSQPNVLTGCENLRDIKFENLKDWKVENEVFYYNTGDIGVEGVENVDRKTFIRKLVDSDYTTNSYLMESEKYW